MIDQVRSASGAIYHNGMKVWLLRYNYDFTLQCGDIRCDGVPGEQAVIDFFVSVDPNVEKIVVYREDKPTDLFYKEDGKWLNDADRARE